MKVIERIKNDPRVSEVWNEGEDGWWVTLKIGFMCRDSECHAVHEWNLRDLWTAFKSVAPCRCKDCAADTTKLQTSGIESSVANSSPRL